MKERDIVDIEKALYEQLSKCQRAESVMIISIDPVDDYYDYLKFGDSEHLAACMAASMLDEGNSLGEIVKRSLDLYKEAIALGNGEK